MLTFIGQALTPPLPRRTLLAAGLAGAVSVALPRLTQAAAPIIVPMAGGNRHFSVRHQDQQIGTHTVLYTATGDKTLVTTEILLLVKTAGFTSYALSHRSEEAWRAGRLVSLASDTKEDGESLHVEGAATPQGFRLESRGGLSILPPGTLTSNSLWTPVLLAQETLIDVQHGGVVGISARKYSGEQIMVGGRRIPATRYAFTTRYLTGNIWYDVNNLWVYGEFNHDGAEIQYVLNT